MREGEGGWGTVREGEDLITDSRVREAIGITF